MISKNDVSFKSFFFIEASYGQRYYAICKIAKENKNLENIEDNRSVKWPE